MIEVTDEREGSVYLNVRHIINVQKEKHGGMTYITMDNGHVFRVIESYETVKIKIEAVRRREKDE